MEEESSGTHGHSLISHANAADEPPQHVDAAAPAPAAYMSTDWKAAWLPVAMHSDYFRDECCGSSSYGHYLFGCKWSPDATCVLACSSESKMHVFEADRWSLFTGTSAGAPDAGAAAVTCRAAETVFDYCWFPKMSSSIPESCCFATTSRDQPLQLWDAFTGGRFASYAGYGDSEELETATAVAFGHDCSRIYGGYNGVVRVWDVAVPGRSCRKVQLFRRAHSVASGQKGLVSCIDSCEHGVAVGSFSGSVAVYDDNMGSGVILGLHGGGPSAGVTQVKWSARCSQVVAAGRRDKSLSVWDVRMGAGQPVMLLPRNSSTNQRILFDVSTCGRYIATPHHSSGDASAHTIRVFDLVTGALEAEIALPAEAFPNAVALHPCAPMFAVSTGQRLYKLPSSGDNSGGSGGSGSDSDDGSETSSNSHELEAALVLFRGSFS